MKMTPYLPAALVLIGMSLLTAAGPASKPAATQPAPSGTDTSIAKDQYHFPAPPSPEWHAVKPDPAADSITYINAKGDGVIQLVLLPKDAAFDVNAADTVAVQMVKQIKQQRAEKKFVMVMDPKVEKDKRFDILIQEKYKAGDHVADQLHIYKSVGPRVLMLTVNSVSDDADQTAAIHKTGEDLMASIKFNRKAFKK